VQELDGINFWSGSDQEVVSAVEKAQRRLSLSMIEKNRNDIRMPESSQNTSLTANGQTSQTSKVMSKNQRETLGEKQE